MGFEMVANSTSGGQNAVQRQGAQRRQEVINQAANSLIWDTIDHNHDTAIELYRNEKNDLVAVILTAEHPPIFVKIPRADAEVLDAVLQSHFAETQATNSQKPVGPKPAIFHNPTWFQAKNRENPNDFKRSQKSATTPEQHPGETQSAVSTQDPEAEQRAEIQAVSRQNPMLSQRTANPLFDPDRDLDPFLPLTSLYDHITAANPTGTP